MKRMNDLPVELRTLVRLAVAELGEVIRRELGDKAYERIESLRRSMADLRERSPKVAHARLEQSLRVLERLSSQDRFYVAHSFGLMLELMNACENAYRTHRLNQRQPARRAQRPNAIVYVLTAHPTEARSPGMIAVFHQIQGVLLDAISMGFDRQQPALKHLLEVAWRLKTARGRKPSVEDEAEHVYSILLREKILAELLDASALIAPIYVRSWVGGDKDGHPGVTERSMVNSLTLSRRRLVKFVRRQLGEARSMLKLLSPRSSAAAPLSRLEAIDRLLTSLTSVRPGDGTRVRKLHLAARAVALEYERTIGAAHPALARIERLLRMFPGLVVPLELRESSELIVQAADGASTTITRMLKTLARVSRGADPRWYARGFVISTASSLEHVKAAARLLKRTLGDLRVPIVPLFEFREALAQAPQIMSDVLRDRALHAAIIRYWNGYFEVMVGYSDSAKENGVLPSRLAIAECLQQLDRVLQRHKVTPVYFHGSGGSVDRGGGSLQEQTAWWPRSALKIYKATIQGEMIERTFASPSIVRGGFEKIAQRAEEALHEKQGASPPKVVREFANRVSLHYRHKLSDPDFLLIVQCATAYRYLSVLRIGSRPSKRTQGFSLSSLRAIPWVLSWTQTRVLFPTWWGVGTAWDEASARDRAALKRAYRRDPLLRSYVKVLGFTLAKIELPVWRIYLERSGIDRALVSATLKSFEAELKSATSFVHALSGERDLLWFRPWLGTSIRLRSPMIHPLNLLQVIALQEKNPLLIRETVTGIASGMMTTG